MNEILRVGRWRVRADVQRTRKAHANLARGGAAECGCSGCRNFEALRSQWLEGPVGRVLESLGIEPAYEVEVFHSARLASGLHLYGGWYHFVGSIESGDEAWVRDGDSDSVRVARFEPLSATLRIGLHTDIDLPRPTFDDLPLVQLDFEAELPWVIDSDELE